MTEEDILYQQGKYWVTKTKFGGFEIWKDGITHADRCSQIGYKGDRGLQRAIYTVDKLHLMSGMIVETGYLL